MRIALLREGFEQLFWLLIAGDMGGKQPKEMKV